MVKTLDAKIKLITASNIEIEINTSDLEYDTIKLMMVEEGADIEMDRMSKNDKEGMNKVLFKKSDTLWQVSANFIDLMYLYYKDFYFQFLKDGNIVAQTNKFKIEPEGRRNLYGIVNKLLYDFNRLWQISGTECIFFMPNPFAEKCPYCWDEDLGQRISTVCEYCKNTGTTNEFIPIRFKARRIRTQTIQNVSSKGVLIKNLVVYTTFSRLNFVLENLFFDTTTREFFQIKNAVPASIGGVRTSTSLTAESVDITDDRVKKLISYLP